MFKQPGFTRGSEIRGIYLQLHPVTTHLSIFRYIYSISRKINKFIFIFQIFNLELLAASSPLIAWASSAKQEKEELLTQSVQVAAAKQSGKRRCLSNK